MKKFLFRGILFIVLFFIVEKGAYYFLNRAPKLEYDKRLEHVINGKVNKDLIIFGASKGASDIIAGQIEKETEFSCYNLSYPGSNIIFHSFILKSLLRFNEKPKKIILVIDNPHEFVDVPSLNFRLDRLYPLSKYDYINNALIVRNEKNILSKLFCLARLNRSNLKLKEIEVPLQNPIDAFGSMPFICRDEEQDFTYKTHIPNYDVKREIEGKIKAFKGIQRLCESNNIQLLFVFPPHYQAFNYKFKNRFEKLAINDNKVMIYDTLNPIYINKDCFYDASHLTEKGARIFTSEISKFINEN